MTTPLYTDLLVTDDDLTLDAGGNPVLVTDRDCIAQDIVHMIRETGLLVELVADRDRRHKEDNKVRLIIEVENDSRIVPGSVNIHEPDDRGGVLYLLAETAEFGPIRLALETR